MRKKRCHSCQKLVDPDELYTKFNVCESCESGDRCEPIAWVNNITDTDDESPLTIGNYFNDTDNEFTVSYHSTDGWRGYYEALSDTYTKVHDDCALSYSENEAKLKSFDDYIKDIANDHNLRIKRVCTRTSNLFSMGVDYFVHKHDLHKFNKLLEEFNKVKAELRDPVDFNRTALFGE